MSDEVKTARKWIDLGDAVAIAMMSLASFLIETTLGLLILPFIGIPLMGGLVSAVLDGALMFIAYYLVPRRGQPLLFAILLLTMSTVTPSFGPVGWYKIFIGVGLGLTIELLLLIIGRNAVTGIIATAIAFGLSIPMTYFAWVRFNIPGIDTLRPYLVRLSLVYTVLGAIGASLGYWIYKTRLSRHSAIVRLREGRREEDE